MARPSMSYSEIEYDESGRPINLRQSTHAPGAGGSSGAAIAALSRGANMAGAPTADPRMMVGKYSPSRQTYKSIYDYSDGSLLGQINDRNSKAYDAANENASYFRSLTLTPYQEELQRQQRQVMDDAREREQYALTLARRKDGLQPTEEGRQFDAKMNLFAQLLGRRGGGMGGFGGGGGYMDSGADPEGIHNGALNTSTRNYLMRMLQGR